MKLKLILGLALFLFVPFSHSLASEPSTDRPPKKLVHHWQYITFPWTLPDEKQCPSFLCGYDENNDLGLRLEIMDIMPEFFKTNVINARLYRADGQIVEPTVEGKKSLKYPISINTANLASAGLNSWVMLNGSSLRLNIAPVGLCTHARQPLYLPSSVQSPDFASAFGSGPPLTGRAG